MGQQAYQVQGEVKEIRAFQVFQDLLASSGRKATGALLV